MKLIKLLKKVKSYEWVVIYDENDKIISEEYAITHISNFNNYNEMTKMNIIYISKVIDFSTNIKEGNSFVEIMIKYKGDK